MKQQQQKALEAEKAEQTIKGSDEDNAFRWGVTAGFLLLIFFFFCITSRE